jgi:hypothetical protein
MANNSTIAEASKSRNIQISPGVTTRLSEVPLEQLVVAPVCLRGDIECVTENRN